MTIPAHQVRFTEAVRTALCGAVLAFGFVGCGGDDGPRQFNINGSVTYKGEPLEAGRISFLPDADRGNSGPVGYAIIQDGKYDTTSAGGKPSIFGPIKVYITGYDNSAEEGAEAKPPLFEDVKVDAEIDPEKKLPTLDFDVPADAK